MAGNTLGAAFAQYGLGSGSPKGTAVDQIKYPGARYKYAPIPAGRTASIMRHLFCGFILWVIALNPPRVLAADRAPTERSDPKDLIGIETYGPSYPSGWTQIESSGFGSSPYILTTLQRDKEYALLLKKQLNKPKKGERIRSTVTDAIGVRNPTNHHRFSRLCYFSGEEATKTSSNIFAEVGFVRYCDMKTALIRRAWKINLETGKFDPLITTKGVTCEYGLVSLGELDSREGCPTYNWR
jgi:hypothetical protein